jgi:hypothetical protein
MRAYARTSFFCLCSVRGEWHSTTKNIILGRRRPKPSPNPLPEGEGNENRTGTVPAVSKYLMRQVYQCPPKWEREIGRLRPLTRLPTLCY